MFFFVQTFYQTQLVECVGDWTLKLSNKQQVDVAHLDFTKVFDSVVHSKFLHKLKCYGFNGLLLDWIKYFLVNKRQMVKLGSSLSDACDVKSGLPQGSGLGPVLFILYINDICEIACFVNEDVTFKWFADDVKVYTCIKHIESSILLQQCLDLICNWATRCQLKLSPSKCNVLSLGMAHVKNMYNSCDVVLSRVSQTADLDILIDDQLSFSPHIDDQLSFSSHIDDQISFSPHIDIVCTKAKQLAAIIFNGFY